MTAKEKAEELIHKYILNTPVGFHFDDAKKCALIAVDEIIKQLVPIEKAPNNKFAFQYWLEVKQEIELL